MSNKKNNTVLKEMQVATPPEVFDPQKAVKQASQAAKVLTSIVKSKPKKIVLNGEQYLTFEDWQTLAKFYGITVGATETKEIWREDKLAGFSAKATVWQKGEVISSAEASCMRDEHNWSNKPEFQLKSMAQTRACAKALRNVLAWVAVLAGFAPTPAEEINGEETEDKAKVFTGNGKCPYCGAVGKYHRPDCPNNPVKEAK